mgnify:CR=1 FL=1
MANPIKIYKTLEEAYNALLKGFRSIKNRDPDIIENQMLKAEAEGKIKSQGDNISIFPEGKPEGIMSQAPGIKSGEVVEAVFKPGMDKRGKMVKESPSQREADLDRPFVTEDEMSAFTMEENARKLNKAKGFIDKLGAKSTRQKLFIADLVEDAGTGVFQDVDMGAVVRSNMFDDLLEQGIDDDLLTNIMYSGTKSDDFTTTLAKIKSNARDEGVDIDETVDFYERVFDEVARVKKAMGGRIGYAVGSLPKGIQKLVQALNKKFGKDTVKTADEMDRPKDVQAFDDFETRNPNPKRQLTDDEIRDYETELGDSETWMNDGTVGEAEKALKDRREFIADMELQYKKGELDPGPGEKGRKEFLQNKMDEMEASGDKRLMTPDEIEELSSLDSDSQMDVVKTLAPKMVERLQLKKKYPGITDDLLDKILIDDNMQRKAEVLATIDEAFKMMEKGKGTDEILDTMKNVTRTKQADGGITRIGLKGGYLASGAKELGKKYKGSTLSAILENPRLLGAELGHDGIMEIMNLLPSLFADGGRANFVGGGMGRRGFLKMLAGLGGGIAAAKTGLLKFAGKEPVKQVAKEVVQKSTTTPPPYFFKLAEKIKMLGADATATTERVIAKSLKSKDGKSEYLLEEDITSGDTIIKKINKESDEMITDVEIMDFKKGEVVMGKNGKPIKTPDNYEEVTEANARIEGDVFNDPYYTDGIEVDEIIKEVDDKVPSIKYASGGLAYMLGE